MIEVEIKTFHGKHKLKQFLTTKSALYKILKGILHMENKDKHTLENMGIDKFCQRSR
jgi:hypothetical protein